MHRMKIALFCFGFIIKTVSPSVEGYGATVHVSALSVSASVQTTIFLGYHVDAVSVSMGTENQRCGRYEVF